MADDPIREAFDLLERERPLPSSGFADALFDRLVEQRRAPAVPGPRSWPVLSPSVRKALVAVAALAIAIAALIPLLPLARNEARPGRLGPGDIVWAHRFSGRGGNVHSATVAASSSGPSIGFPSGPNLYGIQWELYQYGSDGRRRWTLTSVLRSPTIPIASDDEGNVYYVTMHPDAPMLKKYSPAGAELRAELLPFGGYAYGMAVDRGNVYLVGDTFGHPPGSDPVGFHGPFVAAVDPDGAVLWVRPVADTTVEAETPLAVAEPPLTVAVDTKGIYVLGEAASSAGWRLTAFDPDGKVRWSQVLDIAGSVAVDRATVYIAGSRRATVEVTAFSTSGARLWSQRWDEDRGAHVTGIAAGAGGVFIAGTTGVGDAQGSGFVRAFDADGADAWTTSLGSLRVLSIAFFDDALYVGGTVRETDGPVRHVDGFLAKLVAGIVPADSSS